MSEDASLHRVAIPGIEGLALIPEGFFGEHVFLDIPARIRYPMAPVSSIASTERPFQPPRFGALRVFVGIGPGIDTLYEMEYGRATLFGFQIVPVMGQVVDPPDPVRSIAPRGYGARV